MKIPDPIFENTDITDREIFSLMPAELKEFYLNHNGIVALKGGIQFRGCLKDPEHLSIRKIWKGEAKLYGIYSNVLEEDIPIAQDAFGDQFLYRNGSIIKLYGETGDLEDLNLF